MVTILGHVRGLIADALHVRDHLQRRRGDQAQIARHGLLLQKEVSGTKFSISRSF